MTYAHRLRDALDGLVIAASLILVHLRCARTAGQKRREKPWPEARMMANGLLYGGALWALVGFLLWWWLS